MKKVKFRSNGFRCRSRKLNMNYKDTFRLNTQTNMLEIVPDDRVDLQKLVNSSLDTSLDRTLRRLLPVDQIDQVDPRVFMEDDLDLLCEARDAFEVYCSKYGLDPAQSSIDDVLAKIQSTVKGGDMNVSEKKKVESSDQSQVVQADGKQSAP